MGFEGNLYFHFFHIPILKRSHETFMERYLSRHLRAGEMRVLLLMCTLETFIVLIKEQMHFAFFIALDVLLEQMMS